MANHVINKINPRLRILYRQKRFLNVLLRRLPCNTLIQTVFEYGCSASYVNINKKKLKMRLQFPQDKCVRVGLKLNESSN